MKSSSLFWGSLLVCLGLFFLLENFNILELRLKDIIKFWPLLLIVWGVVLLKIPDFVKKVLASFSGIFVAILIISLFNIRISDFINFPDNEISMEDAINDSTYSFYSTSKSIHDLDSASSENKIVELEFDAGVGNFNFKGTTDQLIEVKSANENTEILIEETQEGNKLEVNYGSDKITINSMYDLEKLSKKRYAKVLLSEKPIWNIDIDAGVAKMHLDFKDKKVKRLTIDAGVSDVDLILGDKVKELSIDIETGVSNINIQIPKSVGCSINSDAVLSADYFEGFYRKNGRFYQTKNFEDSEKRIYIQIDGALSDFNVIRY